MSIHDPTSQSPLPAKDDVVVVLIGASQLDHPAKTLPRPRDFRLRPSRGNGCSFHCAVLPALSSACARPAPWAQPLGSAFALTVDGARIAVDGRAVSHLSHPLEVGLVEECLRTLLEYLLQSNGCLVSRSSRSARRVTALAFLATACIVLLLRSGRQQREPIAQTKMAKQKARRGVRAGLLSQLSKISDS